MAKNPLFNVQTYGQSIWYDSISRPLVSSGDLQRLVDDYAVVGVTSNPTIFEKALAATADYDADIQRLSEEGLRAPQIFERLATDDIRLACDVLRPLYERSGHVDGRVSIEVGPLLAHHTEETIVEARRLWQTVDRPNLMVKIPATEEGIPAIEQMISEGVSINVTLIFAVSVYERVAEAYLRGLERRVAAGQPIDQIHSVASVFVSRIDTAVDKEIEARLGQTSDASKQEQLRGLLGKVAIANAKVAYLAFQRIFDQLEPNERWTALQTKGANLQRLLWASTGTKNPAYPDTLYITELVGPHTVNTVPESALLAFADHGVVRGNALEENVDEAHQVLRQLADQGIDLEEVTERRLVAEGVKSFATSFDTLIAELRKKRDAIEVK